jgi:hypothetical protein
MNVVKPLVVLMLVLTVSACAERDKWIEEVLLPDGRSVIINRSVKIEVVQFDGWMKAPTLYSFWTTNPSTGAYVHWRGEFGMSPILLGYEAGVAFLVIVPNRCNVDLVKYGTPNPPYIALRYDRGEWIQIPRDQLPSSFTRANMSSDYSRYLIKDGRLSRDAIQGINRAVEFSSASHFQVEIPADFTSWNYKHKDPRGYQLCS